MSKYSQFSQLLISICIAYFPFFVFKRSGIFIFFANLSKISLALAIPPPPNLP